ncbi:gp19.5 family protein [Pseudomonas sp. P2758]|uniref:gp19.5 family protein n=1 Tax=Pseudomonas sp. P2758 TaxID=3409916 RepID=UPI003B5CA46F
MATHRVTYRFLGLLLVSLGVSQGGPLVETFGNVVCVLLVAVMGDLAVVLVGHLRGGKDLHHPHTPSSGQ